MGLFNSSNPALSENTLKNISVAYDGQTMTINGTIWKTVFGVLLTLAGGFYVVYAVMQNPAILNTLFLIGITIIWEGDDASQSKNITYRELHRDVCRFANVLLDLGIKKGDVVAIYMPMVPEAAVAMLACARIGAIHSVIFGGFSPEAVAGRIIDSNSRLVITADEGLRAGRAIPLKKNVDDALKNPNVKSIENVVVLKRTGGKIDWQEGRDQWWSDLIEKASVEHQPEEMNAEDPLFILYTSGSTGKPKGVLHTTGGYLVYAATTFKYSNHAGFGIL